MRFKAKLAQNQVQLLYNLITPISRLNGGSGGGGGGFNNSSLDATNNSFLGGVGGTIIHLDPEHLRMSTRGIGSSTPSTPFFGGGGTASGSGNDGYGIACFAELSTRGGIFLEHRIESAANNVIVFEISLGQLRLALQSILASGRQRAIHGGNTQPLHNSTREQEDVVAPVMGALTTSLVVMKLAKRGGMPCLCLDAQGGGGGGVDVHHAVPVRVMRAEEMQYHLPPRINMPNVQLELPADRPIRAVVERLRMICPHVYIEGSMAGELTLRIDGDAASIRTFYNKLIPRFEDCKPSESGETLTKCTLKVDSKKLHACLQWQGTLLIGRAVSSAVLCMVENEMLVLHVMLNPGSVGFFTYYVPVHFLSSDQMD